MLIRDDEIDLIAEAWPSFAEAAKQVEWPIELETEMRSLLGEEWFALVLAAIASRESRMGLLLDSNMKGDSGHGHGIMQIDDRSHQAFIRTGKWRHLEDSLAYVNDKVILVSYNYLSDYFDETQYVSLFWAAIAAYNCGPGNVRKAIQAGKTPDSRTTGKDYSQDVRNRAMELQQRLED